MNEQRLEQAADFIDRINDLNEHEYKELVEWLSCPLNKKAFEKMANVFGDPTIKQCLHTYAQTHNVTTHTFTPKQKTKQTTRFLALAASFAAIALIVYWQTIPSQVPVSASLAKNINKTQPKQILKASVGERKSQLLNDGSYLHLNADSELSASLLPNAREIELKKGQVFFDVAKDKTRPFIINSGQAKIKVLGTSFDVERNKNNVLITVYEGSVEVSAADTVVLKPPQQARVKNGIITLRNDLLLSQLPSWRTGFIEADNEPLSHILTQLQRYSSVPITVNKALSDTLISGRFNLETPKSSLMLIASTYQWEIKNTNNTLYLTTP
ncbi:FecR domain-containing protein [Pseudoalteromonas sp. MMG010]|uniref:FecR family protein n=1 Tax=Pseudoalteromonas sp. MMG010 TaxID=2822685 RepID=UPI001B3A118D|nr:FecR domain-containing protein [Pseudoalteromonas sp. MMG010]MBQ4833566.1 FecR domain-containing protein [Pseudoalteromonas sp. MMG010]